MKLMPTIKITDKIEPKKCQQTGERKLLTSAAYAAKQIIAQQLMLYIKYTLNIEMTWNPTTIQSKSTNAGTQSHTALDLLRWQHLVAGP